MFNSTSKEMQFTHGNLNYDYFQGGERMTKHSMTKEAAARIQSNAAKTGHNQDFARRAQSAADK